jgi:putative NADPH-quinone reductase
MSKSVCIINGHPDPSTERLVRALCDAYEDGCRASGFGVSRINIGELEVDLLGSASAFETPPAEAILTERKKIAEADHMALIFPLWLGGIPAKTKAFFEQAARGSFFLAEADGNTKWPRKMMKGKSARLVVTMGMPGIVYKAWLDEGALKVLERGMLGMSGFGPIHHTILGGAGELSARKVERWLTRMHDLGLRGE